MVIEHEHFGKTSDGQSVERYTLTNGIVTVKVVTLGGCIQSMLTPDKYGNVADITTGFDTVAEYEENSPYFGALVGRCANRICQGRFQLDGKTYRLAINNPPNHLHGGPQGWHMKIWQASLLGDKLCLEHTSPDGDEGYPGEVQVTVSYELTDQNELSIDYTATCSKACPLNFTNHAYYNLAGHKATNVYDHTLQVQASKYTPKNDDNIPTGEIASVASTVYDMQKPTLLGDSIPKITFGNIGFDNNYCIDGEGEKKLAARLAHEASGRSIEVYTSMPGIQIYTANYLEGLSGKDGAVYGKHSCVAMETQHYPDAINQPTFPESVIRPGESYKQKTWYKFIVAES